MKRFFCFFVVLFFAVFCTFALTDQETGKAFSVFSDAVICSVVSDYSQTDILLDNVSLTIDKNTGLPEKIVFIGADPGQFKAAVKSALIPSNQTSGKNLFSVLLGSLSQASADPLLAALSLYMGTKKYNAGDYIIEGTASFSFTQGVSKDKLLTLYLTKTNLINEKMFVEADLKLQGNMLEEPFSIKGEFEAGINQEGLLYIKNKGIFFINGQAYTKGEFTF